jgi:hypothetical protein
MGFDYPVAFIFLLVIFPALWILLTGIRRTGKVARLYKDKVPSKNYKIFKSASLIILMASLVTAGAKPYLEPLRTGDYLFMSDISRSMMARNFCSEPTFLDRSREIMHFILDEVPEGRFGIMVFARLAFPITQMTFDHKYLHEVIDNGLRVGMIFEATATSLPNSLSEFARKKATYPDIYGNVKYIILFSDGYMEGEWRNELALSMEELRQSDLKVLAVGIGNPGETPIPRVVRDECYDDYLQYNGRILRIPLQDDLMKFIATETGGEYFGEGNIDELVRFVREETLVSASVETGFTIEQQRDISWIFLLSATIATFLFLIV